MRITTEEVRAEEVRLAKLHGVDLDKLTLGQLKKVRTGISNRSGREKDDAIVRALTAAWLKDDVPSLKVLSSGLGRPYSTVGHDMLRMTEAGVLTRLSSGGRRIVYIPTELHRRAMEEPK